MTPTVGQMTPDELRDLIEAIVDQKLTEILRDPDLGLELDAALAERLYIQQAEVANGERGLSLSDVLSQLALD